MIDRTVRKLLLLLEIAWNQADVDAVVQLFGANAIVSLANERRFLRNRVEILDPIRRAMAANPWMRVELRHIEVIRPGCASTWLEYDHSASKPEAEVDRSFGLAVWSEGPDGVRIRSYCETIGHFPRS